MKRKLAAAVVTAGVLGGIAPPVSADPGIGQPPDPPCFGQNVVFFAQTYGGIPNAAEAFGVTIQEGHNLVRSALCGRTTGIVPAP